MKKNFAKLAMMAAVMMTAGAMMTACSNDLADEGISENPMTAGEPTEVTLTFSPYEVTAMGGGDQDAAQTSGSQRASTRAARRAAVSEFADRIDIWLYESGSEVYAAHQYKTDDGFASVAVTLNKTKTYTLYAVAHKGTDVATLADGVVTFPGDKVTHSFFYSQTFTPATTTSLSCQMQRIVGMFRVETTDAVPSEVKKVIIGVSATSTRWNVAGYGENPLERTLTYNNINTNDYGQAGFNVYIMAENDEPINCDITVTAYNASDAVVKAHTFTNVPIRNSYRTTYKGTFFTDQAFSASFTTADWTDYDETTY